MMSTICSVSFASSVTAANIKASLEKCLGQDIIIKSDSSKTTLSGGLDDLILTDSQIGGKLEGTEYILFNYAVADNLCTFNANIEDLYKAMQIDITKVSQDDLNSSAVLLALVNYMYMEEFYISTADSVGKDLSLAYTYLAQEFEKVNSNEEKVDINISNEVFSLIMKSNDKNVIETATLTINLDNLTNLSESKNLRASIKIEKENSINIYII